MRARTFSPELTRLAAAIRSLPMAGAGLGAMCALPVFAGPLGEQVAAGSVAVARPDGLNTQVTQSSQNAVVNWNSFSVGEREYVQFVQPNAHSAILNRVVGGGESEIFGRLDANGRVFLVNPQGVYFGPSAKVDASGFAASALDVSDSDFMAGRYVFSKPASGAATGTVTNDGEINASQFAVLMGDRVGNEGLIQARLGTVVLAAGSATTLHLDESGLVNFAVNEKSAAALAGVENIADGGQVLMTAKVADGLVATAVNNEGLIRAHSIAEENGEIFLRASGGDIVNRGTLDVAGEAGRAGGTVVIKGNQDVVLDPASTITATGNAGGAGGTVRLIADGKLEVREGSRVNARGGVSGKGGLIELSANHGFVTDGDIRVGRGGQVLIDPRRLEILNDSSSPGYFSGETGCGLAGTCDATIGKRFIEGMLSSSSNVTLVASDEIFARSSFAISSFTSASLTIKIGTLTSAGRSVGSLGDFSSDSVGCFFTGACVDGPGFGSSTAFFAPDADGSINLGSVDFSLGGDLRVEAGTKSGDINLGTISIGGDFVAHAQGDIRLGDVFASNIRINDDGPFSSPAPSNISAGTLIANNPSSASIRIRGKAISVENLFAVAGASSESSSGATGPAEIAIAAQRLNVNGTMAAIGDIGSIKINLEGDGVFNGTVLADAIAVGSSKGSLQFNGLVLVGDAPLPPEVGDSFLLGALSNVKRIGGPGIPRFRGLTAVGPNAAFRARGDLLFRGGLHFSDPDTPYVIFQTDGILDFGPGVTAEPHEDFLAQFTTFDANADIRVEESPEFGPANFYNSLHFSRLPGTTILLGSGSLQTGAHLGRILVGGGGPINLGGQNFLVATKGVSSVSPGVTSRGFIGQLAVIGGTPQFIDASTASIEKELEEVFEVPIVNEFGVEEDDITKDDEDDDEEYVDIEGEGDLEGDELVSQQSNTGQLCE
jgi:filamentous hemagglutinin family protein